MTDAIHREIKRALAERYAAIERALELAAKRAIQTGRAQEVRVPDGLGKETVYFFQRAARA